jgi:hypothetical protein
LANPYPQGGPVCFQLPEPWGYYCINIPSYGNLGLTGGAQQSQQNSFQPQSTIAPSSNGGVFALGQIAVYPCLNTVTNQMEYRTFDVTQPQNDPVNPSSYSWRVEQLKAFRNPTVRKIFWTFTDLGQVSVTWSIQGTNELGKVVGPISTGIGVGNNPATRAILTTEVDLFINAMNLQLSVSKTAGAGPLSVVKVVMVGEVEDYIP